MADGVERAQNVPRVVDGLVPPHDLDSEAAVLAAVMIDPLAFDRVADTLRPEHFYSEAHRRIYEAAVELSKVGQPVDVVQVGAWLKSRERIAQVGGMGYLTEVLNAAPAVANVAAYGATIHEKWRVRQLIATCQRVAAEGYIDYGDAGTFIDGAEAAIYAIAHEDTRREAQSAGEIVRDRFRKISKALERGDRITGTSTGFDRYDRMTAGLHDGDLTIIAGRPGMGKSALALQLALNVASPRDRGDVVEPGDGVFVFSLEMPKEQVADRFVCSDGKVDVSKLRTGFLAPQDWAKLTRAAESIYPLPLWVDDTPAVRPLEIRARVRRKQAEYDRPAKDGQPARRVGLVVIDYLQLMSPDAVDGKRDQRNREQEVSSISRALKGLAKELRLPVIALSQLNRSVETRSEKSKRPQLSDLRESGSIEQDSDNVVFVYRDDYYNPDSDARNIAELIIAKQRNGPTGTVHVRFDKEYTRFDNLAEGEFEGNDGYEDRRAGPDR